MVQRIHPNNTLRLVNLAERCDEAGLVALPFFGSPERGYLSILEKETLPFPIRRVYWISEVPEGVWRGEHAHLTTRQLVFCPTLAPVTFILESLSGEIREFRLTAGQVLLIPPLHWIRFRFAPDAALVVLASTEYNPNDSIFDYSVFRSLNPEPCSETASVPASETSH